MQIDDLEKMFGAIAANGWGGIDNAGADARKMAAQDQQEFNRRRAEEAKIIAKALGDEDGIAALLLLLKKTVLRSPSDEERAVRSAEQYAILKAKREGQNDLIFMIMNMLRVAKGEKTDQGGTEL